MAQSSRVGFTAGGLAALRASVSSRSPCPQTLVRQCGQLWAIATAHRGALPLFPGLLPKAL